MMRRARTGVLATAVLALLGGGQAGCAWLSGYDGDDYALAGGGAGGGSAAGGLGGTGGSGAGGGGAGGSGAGGSGAGGAFTCASDLYTGPENVVFVLRIKTNGDLDGVFEADKRCEKAAEACFSGRTWRAFLSTPTQKASDRINSSASASWVRPDGVVVFPNVNTFDDGPSARINLDQFGRLLSVSGPVWTGMQFFPAQGPMTSDARCNEWNDATSEYGEVTNSGGLWTESSPLSCSEKAHLYCFET